MRLAILRPNPEPDPTLDRLIQAAVTAGWTVKPCRVSGEIEAFAPDLVFAAEAGSAKCTGHPWLGWFRQTPSPLRHNRREFETLLSHDGWLTDDREQATFLADTLLPTGRPADLLCLADIPPERLPARLQALAAAIRVSAGFTPSTGGPEVDYVVRVGGRGVGFVRRCLDSLAAQSASGVGAILVRYAPVAGLEAEFDRQQQRLRRLRVIDVPMPTTRSACLWTGLMAAEADLVGVLDDDDALHPNHVASLAPLALDGGVACAGSVQVWEEAEAPSCPPSHQDAEPRSFHALPGDDVAALFNWRMPIHSSAFLASTALLPTIGPDPELDFAEDTYLLRRLLRAAPLRASWRVSTDFYWRRSRDDNTAFRREGRDEVMRRIADRERLDPLVARRRNGTTEELSLPPAWGQPAGPACLPALARPADFWALPAGRPLHIYGSGYGGRVVLGELSKIPHLDVAGFLDSRERGTAHGLPRQLPADLSSVDLAEGVFIVASEFVAEMVETLRQCGARHIHDASPFIRIYTDLRQG